jgi:Glyoxalase superfamily protein
VDVVTFDSFSNFRKRVWGVVGPLGESREKTSDGQPHLVIERGV